jgi:hypothetical protein
MAVATVLIGLTAGAGTLPASAADRGDPVSAKPAPGSSLSSTGNFYLLPAEPGASVTQSVRVTNPNPAAVTVELEPVDAVTSVSTGTSFGAPGSPKAITSRWIVVAAPEIRLEPGEERDVEFTVHVPDTAEPGQYLAGVSASIPVDENAKPEDAGPRGAAFAMAIRLQRVIAVQIELPGTWAPQLVVTGAEPMATPDGVALGVHMANKGNAFAKGSGVIRVASTETDFTFPVDTFVPGTAIVFSMPWTKTVEAGTHNVQVDLEYDDGRRVSWNGDIELAGSALTRLEDELRNITVPPKDEGIDPLVVVAGIVGVAFVGGAVTLRRRARRPGYVKYRAA